MENIGTVLSTHRIIKTNRTYLLIQSNKYKNNSQGNQYNFQFVFSGASAKLHVFQCLASLSGREEESILKGGC